MADPLPILKLCVEAELTSPPKPMGIAVLSQDGTVIGFVQLDWFYAVAAKLAVMRAEYMAAKGH